MSLRAYFARGGSVALSANGEVLVRESEEGRPDMLVLLDRALGRAGRKRSEITEIAVDHGPDGFSAVRSRVAVASGLAAALRASLAAVGEITHEEAAGLAKRMFRRTAVIEPEYIAEPNITQSKKRGYGRA